MKIKYLFLTLAAALIAGCSDDLDRSGAYNPEKGVTASIPTYSFDGGTRVNISDDLQTFTWSDGDKLGLYYQGSNSTAHAAFSIINGGGSTGNFENEAFILKSSSTYYAFYPFNESATIASAPVDFTGQVQNGNGSAAHLGAYNYMYSTVNTDGNGNASILFKNLGAVMQIRLTVSETASYTSIDITSHGSEFITKGTASMVDGSVTATETSHSIHLDFENGIALNAGDVLTANILTAPVDLFGKTIIIALTDTEGQTYEVAIAGKNMLQGKAYLYEGTMADDSNIPYITFTADAEQTFRFAAYVGVDEGTGVDRLDTLIANLEYSLNNQDWVTMSGPSSITFGGVNGNLRIRGKNPNGTSIGTDIFEDPYSQISFGNETPVSCSGDIRTLVDFGNFSSVTTDNVLFVRLFSGCSQLTSAPELPATMLASSCYLGMFQGCTSLTQAPELPATNLASECYNTMFNGCTSLTQAPELPATTLAPYCYYGMFFGCTSLTQAPELPATTLAAGCYKSMFLYCTSLTQAPELPATTLADGCYSSMFQGCTSLTQAPELPATNLASECYHGMFYGCTSLTQAPELHATNLVYHCYYCMFFGCTSLTQAPELPATNLANYCYNFMFRGCTSLTQAPELPATDLADGCYLGMFQGCTSLTQAPELPATNLASECYYNMFCECTSLTQAPELPATTLAPYCYYQMFRGCTSLTQAPELPATNLANYCYNFMFWECTSLTQAPELPATNLAEWCYSQMFYGCTNLNYIKMMATDISASKCLNNWVKGVSSTGTFVKNKDATWDVTGTSGIPESWTVITE